MPVIQDVPKFCRSLAADSRLWSSSKLPGLEEPIRRVNPAAVRKRERLNSMYLLRVKYRKRERERESMLVPIIIESTDDV